MDMIRIIMLHRADPMGYVAKTVYDKDSRVTEETDALGQKESIPMIRTAG